MDYEQLKQKIYNYDTKYKEGFIWDEIEKLLKEFPNINKEKFNKALEGNTCLLKDDKYVIYYPYDILIAVRCGLENREIKLFEWD